MFDLVNNLLPKRGFSPAAVVTDNTAYVSEIIDTQGYEAMLWLILIGALADVDATMAVLIEESVNSDMSSQSDVADSQLNPTESVVGFDFADDDSVRRIEVRPTKRYVRLTITPANNTGDMFIAMLALLGNARHKPETAQAD